MARWSELTERQQKAIMALTREAPNDKPNGPAEAAIEKIGRLLQDVESSPFTRQLNGLMADLCEAEADQIRALRLAFGLAKDGVTPTEGG